MSRSCDWLVFKPMPSHVTDWFKNQCQGHVTDWFKNQCLVIQSHWFKNQCTPQHKKTKGRKKARRKKQRPKMVKMVVPCPKVCQAHPPLVSSPPTLSVKLTQVPKSKRFQSVSRAFPAFPDLKERFQICYHKRKGVSRSRGAFPDLLPKKEGRFQIFRAFPDLWPKKEGAFPKNGNAVA